MGFGTSSPPWSGKANLTGPWFSGEELASTSTENFVMTKGKGEQPANAAQATFFGAIDPENMAPMESWPGSHEHHART
ncbi:hypothetical protein HBI64_059740 [Parastagonospora nodorum]|nr:hypothetical protein HBI11_032160 [Parastagonospora nodorum]KAH5774979.1 hypothetical protein HBI16_102870 [Parastagonospora nodorum]KAH6032112.1 hypothetical protein HBI83_024050 [Parastagonospora nodorum]KAH6134876.1 hypothetical protein HBI64_059740 [Parastagonospora nodorum]KAH6313721.1 hypothetical protein HBI39_049000 [Parastagonospora nodorum]